MKTGKLSKYLLLSLVKQFAGGLCLVMCFAYQNASYAADYNGFRTCMGAIESNFSAATCGPRWEYQFQDVGYSLGVYAAYICPDIADFGSCNLVIDRISPESTGQPPAMCPKRASGSIVNVDMQTVGESIPVLGTDFSLVYSSLWAQSRKTDYKLRWPIVDGTPESGVSDFDVEVKMFGNTVYTQTVPNSTYQTISYDWDGLNASSLPEIASARVELFVKPDGLSVPAPIKMTLGVLKARLLGFGGWLPSNYHFYDSKSKVLYRGDGSTTLVDSIAVAGGNLLVPEGDGSLVYEFSSAGKHLYTRTGLLGTAIATFGYNGSGLLTSISEPFSRTTTFSRDGSGNLSAITSPDGIVTAISVNGAGLLQSVTSPGSATFLMTYGSGTDLLATFEKPEGQNSSFSYNSDGELIGDYHSGGYQFSLTRSTPSGTPQLTHVTGEGRATSSIFTNTLNLTSSGRSGSYSRADYLPTGATSSITESSNAISVFRGGYTKATTFGADVRFGDILQAPVSVSEASRNTYISQTLNPANVDYPNPSTAPFSFSTLTTATTVGGLDTVSVFNTSTKTFTTTSPEGRVRSTVIDTYERPTSNQWASDNATNYSYANDKLTLITEGSRTTAFSYGTSSGLLNSVTNALSETTAFTYDADRRLTYITYPDLRAVQFSYDANGNVVGVTPPGRSQHGLTLNGHELLGTYAPPTLSGVSVVNTGYTYNNDKQLTQITRPDAQTIVFEYGSTTGLLEKITTPDGDYTYGFDTTSERYNSGTTPSSVSNSLAFTDARLTSDTLNDSSGYVANYAATYNSLLQLASDTVSPASGSPSTINYTYDDDELLTGAGALAITRGTASGRIAATDVGNIVDTWSYNSYGELTGYAASYGTSPIFSYSITRDALGRVDTLSETVYGTTSSYNYDYDNSGRLTTVTKGTSTYSSYTYDNNSNRVSGNTGGTSFTAVVDAQDRLTDYNNFDYTYTANGELATKVNTLTSQTTTYNYDVLGNLKSVVPPTGSTISYVVDSFNRRIARKVGSSTTAKYVYANQLQIAAELTSANALRTRFIYGTKPHVPDYMVKGGVKYRIITDHLGSVRLVVRDSNGSVAQRLEYNELGAVLVDTSPGFQPFGFAGGLYDSDTKLIKFGARDYDPDTGRWTSKDPLRFSGEDANLYGYVVGDPVNLIDPDGERWQLLLPYLVPITRFLYNCAQNPNCSGSWGKKWDTVTDFFKDRPKPPPPAPPAPPKPPSCDPSRQSCPPPKSPNKCDANAVGA